MNDVNDEWGDDEGGCPEPDSFLRGLVWLVVGIVVIGAAIRLAVAAL